MPVKSYTSLGEVLNEIASHLPIPKQRWLDVSKLYHEFMTKTKLTDFM